MAELLLELFSEEIPARMQPRAAEDLARLVGDGLKAAGLDFETIRSFATPRRLTVVVDGLPARSPDLCEEKKGPRVGAPEQAIQGFLKSTGLASLDQAKIQSDKKGEFYVALLERPGRPTPDIVAALVPEIVHAFPWPKAMRWGSGRLRWVRPLHAILCLFDGEVVPFEIDGIETAAATRGHRFMAPEPFAVKGFEDYVERLDEAYVVLDGNERVVDILQQARALAASEGLTLIEDEALLAENAGLTEWPVVLMGAFDESFLDVPPEVLATAMKAHQKCFSLRRPLASRRGLAPAPQHEDQRRAPDPHPEEGRPSTDRLILRASPEIFRDRVSKDERSAQDEGAVAKDEAPLANRFIMVANLEAADGGKAIAAGNERVIRARLADAKFFFDHDRKIMLEDRVPKLKDIVFHDKLGTQYERVQRVRVLARDIAKHVGADPDLAERAGILAKADLTSDMVGEFPELQGVMGRYYALDQEEDPLVADAIAAHYKPVGPSDQVPREPVGIAVALADKLDMLVGFWAIDEKPTGSKDPYALRRAALGVIRIILENDIRAPLTHIFEMNRRDEPTQLGMLASWLNTLSDEKWASVKASLLAFFADRLKVHLRDQGARHDLIDAVFALPGQDDLLMIVRRVEALGRFLDTEDGANLLIGTKRAINILRIEEKKDGKSFDQPPAPKLFKLPEEKALAKVVDDAEQEAAAAVRQEDFEAAMGAIARLRSPVDAFFDNVTVNAEEPELRDNRLRLLNRIRATTLTVADFSKIEG